MNKPTPTHKLFQKHSDAIEFIESLDQDTRFYVHMRCQQGNSRTKVQVERPYLTHAIHEATHGTINIECYPYSAFVSFI